jgi:hypothetical protein
MIIGCKDVEFGSGDCAYTIWLPYKLKDASQKCVRIDKCLLPEIVKLWEKGVRTTGCCCGHGDKKVAFISVSKEYIEIMEKLGYHHIDFKYIEKDKIRKDLFQPKTRIKYRKIAK